MSKTVSAARKLEEDLVSRYRADVAGLGGQQRPARIVVFLGAGASRWSGMPLWDSNIIGNLLAAAEKCFTGQDAFVDDAWEKLSPYIGLPPEDAGRKREALIAAATPEQICSVASSTGPTARAVLSVLKEYYGTEDEAGPRPQLGYELLAHLLRHRFIDHIITFNFDETIDCAVENELGRDGFETIVSDQHPLRFPGDADRPRLIKLHGTISSPGSLRFTLDNTRAFSPDTLRLLDETTFGASKDADVHIVSLGYGWKDPDIANWVAARWGLIHRVTIVRRKESVPELLTQACAREKIDPRLKIALLPTYSIGCQISTDEVMWALWRRVQSGLDEMGIPYVPASRHIILGCVFGPQDPRRESPITFPNRHRRRERLPLEIFLHTVKSKGMVNLSVIARNRRIHRYFQAATGWEPSWLTRSSEAHVKETFFAKATTFELLSGDRNAVGVFGNMPETVGVPEFRNDGTVGIQRVKKDAFLEAELRSIFGGPEVELSSTADPRTEWLFPHSTFLGRYQQLRARTQELVEGNWSDLFVVAESGAWLADKATLGSLTRRSAKGKIYLITASDEGLEQWALWRTIRKELGNTFQTLRDEGYEIFEARVPWWRHNRHLTLALTINNRAVSQNTGIYFRRRLKTDVVAPVWFHSSDRYDPQWSDALTIFAGYVKRACSRARVKERNNDQHLAKALARAVVERLDLLDLRDVSHEPLRKLRGELTDNPGTDKEKR